MTDKKERNYFEENKSLFNADEIERINSIASRYDGAKSFSEFYNTFYPQTREGQDSASKQFIKYPKRSKNAWIKEYKNYLNLFNKEHLQKVKENMIMDSFKEKPIL